MAGSPPKGFQQTTLPMAKESPIAPHRANSNRASGQPSWLKFTYEPSLLNVSESKVFLINAVKFFTVFFAVALITITSVSCHRQIDVDAANSNIIADQTALHPAEIAQYFSDNKVAAYAKYKGKSLQIEGKVTDICRTWSGGMTVCLDSNINNHDMRCRMKADQEENVAGIRKCQVVIIRGICKGLTLGDVVLNDCIIDKGEMERRKKQWERIATEKARQQKEQAAVEAVRFAKERRKAAEKDVEEFRHRQKAEKEVQLRTEHILTSERDTQEQLGREYAKERFAGVSGIPNFIFSPVLGIGNPKIECVGKAKELSKTLQKALQESKWDDLRKVFKGAFGIAGTGDGVTPDEVDAIINGIRSNDYRYEVVVRTNVELKRTLVFYCTCDTIEAESRWSEHPDGNAWIIPWNPMMREGIVITGSVDIVYRWRSWIDNKLSRLRRTAELEGKRFSEEPVRKMLVKTAWENLKAECLDTGLDGSDNGANPSGPKSPLTERPVGGNEPDHQSSGSRAGSRQDGSPNRGNPEKQVTLVAPYPEKYTRQHTNNKISVQYAIIAICEQAGFKYDWKASVVNTDPIRRQWVHLQLRDMSWKEAMKRILSPVGLTYELHGNTVVLKRR